MQETMLPQDRLHEHIDAIAEDDQRDPAFGASSVQNHNPLINRQLRGKSDHRLAVGLNELHLTSQAFLTGDLTLHPATLPLTPGRKREGLQHGIGGIDLRDRAIEITEDLGHDRMVVWQGMIPTSE